MPTRATRRKSKVRWGTLGAALGSVAGVVLTVVSDPHVITTVAGKVGLSAAALGVIVTAVKKAVVRDEDER